MAELPMVMVITNGFLYNRGRLDKKIANLDEFKEMGIPLFTENYARVLVITNS